MHRSSSADLERGLLPGIEESDADTSMARPGNSDNFDSVEHPEHVANQVILLFYDHLSLSLTFLLKNPHIHQFSAPVSPGNPVLFPLRLGGNQNQVKDLKYGRPPSPPRIMQRASFNTSPVDASSSIRVSDSLSICFVISVGQLWVYPSNPCHIGNHHKRLLVAIVLAHVKQELACSMMTQVLIQRYGRHTWTTQRNLTRR